MNVHLSEESRRFVADQVAAGLYPSEEAVLEDALARMRERQPTRGDETQAAKGDESPATAQKPIWEVFAEISASIPDEEWAKVPSDASHQLDHYVYGSPKRPTP